MGSTDDIGRQVQKVYDEYGEYFSKTRKRNWPVVESYTKRLAAGMSVLDVGCGNGRLIDALPDGVKYLGFDFSKTLLDKAKELHPEHEFLFGDVLDPNIWKIMEKYDAVFCIAVLHHIPTETQQVYLLKEMKKHLKPGGLLYLTVWNLWQDKYVQYHLPGEKAAEVPFMAKWKRYCVVFDQEGLSEICSRAGWEVEKLGLDEEGRNLVVVAK